MAALEDRLWDKIDIRGDDECWPWTASTKESGYGQIREGAAGSRTLKAHRVVYELVNGPLPPDVNACHECDNPICCNPRHLWPGTFLENQKDKVSKGRQAKGSAITNCRLTEEDVVSIMARLLSGESQAATARHFGVTQSAISDVWTGRTWAHLWEEN